MRKFRKEKHNREARPVCGVEAVAFSPDGKLLAAGGWDKTVRVWTANGDKQLAEFTGHEESIRCIAFSPNGKILASLDHDGLIYLWNLKELGD